MAVDRSGATLKLAGWTPQSPPEDNSETEAYRKLIVEAVNLNYRIKLDRYVEMGFPSADCSVQLREIFRSVQNHIDALRRINRWPYGMHGKRWVDRRVNETASPAFYPNKIPHIVAVRAGFYLPNHEMRK